MLTMVMVTLLTLQVAVISLVALRSVGETGVVATQKASARWAAETAILRLSETLYEAREHTTLDALDITYSSANATPQLLQANDPDSGGLQDTPIYISAWIAERRGSFYRLAGRAQNGPVDITLYRWISFRPCQESTLTTLLDGVSQPGAQSLEVDSKGRVFIGQNAIPGSLWMWDPGSRMLTTLLSVVDIPGATSLQVSPVDDRVYWAGVEGGSIKSWTWHADTGLSVLLSSTPPKNASVAWSQSVIGPDGRLFIGESGNAMNPASFYTWSPQSNALSVLIENRPAQLGVQASLAVSPEGRVFVSETGTVPGVLWSWKEHAGLASVTFPAGVGNVGYSGYIAAGINDRVYLGGMTLMSDFWTWAPGSGLSALATVNQVGAYMHPRSKTVGPPAITGPDGRVYFTTITTPGNPRAYTWSVASGLSVLLTMPAGQMSPVRFRLHENGVYIVPHQLATPTSVWSWNASTGQLTTIIDSVPGTSGDSAVDESGRLALGKQTAVAGHIRVWDPAAGQLTTLLNPPVLYPGSTLGGMSGVMSAPKSGRLLFAGIDPNIGGTLAAWSWAPGDGLTTVFGGGSSFAPTDMVISDAGWAYFSGQQNVWAWKTGRMCW